MANNLTMVSPTYTTTAQKFGSAALSGGSGSVAAGTTIVSSATSFTIEAWLKTTVSAVGVAVQISADIWIGQGNNNATNNGYVCAAVGPGLHIYPNVALNDGNWHHVRLCNDATSSRLYMDGALVGTGAAITGFGSSPQFAVRTYPSSTGFSFAGQVDEVAVWNNAVTTGSTYTVPAAPYTGAETGLLALYHLDSAGTDSSGTTAATTYTLAGPASGATGVASANFTVTASGTLASSVTVTPSDASNGGTFSPTSVTLASGSNTSATFVYTPASTGTKTISTTNSGTLTDPSAVTYTATAALVTIARNNAAIYYAPGVWADDGTSANANSMGSYLSFRFTGTSLAMSIVALSGIANYPVVRAYIDSKSVTEFQVTSGQTSVAIATGLTAGTHTVTIMLRALADVASVWTLTNALKITSFVIDGGATVSAPTIKSKKALIFGDSISVGAYITGTTAYPAGWDPAISYSVLVAQALGAEYGLIGYDGQGFTKAGSETSIPALSTAYALNSSGVSRLTSGRFTSAPDYIICEHGVNGSYAQSDVATAISNFRTAAPSAVIFFILPLGNYGRPTIAAAVNAAIAAGDTKLFLIDLGSDYFASLAGSGNGYSVDGTHPLAWVHAIAAARMVAQVQHDVEPRRFTVVTS